MSVPSWSRRPPITLARTCEPVRFCATAGNRHPAGVIHLVNVARSGDICARSTVLLRAYRPETPKYARRSVEGHGPCNPVEPERRKHLLSAISDQGRARRFAFERSAIGPVPTFMNLGLYSTDVRRFGAPARCAWSRESATSGSFRERAGKRKK